MRFYFLSTTLLIAIFLLSCDATTKNDVRWPYGVKYEVFVMSFADGDGNDKGDFDSKDGGIAIHNDELKLPAYSTVILKQDYFF